MNPLKDAVLRLSNSSLSQRARRSAKRFPTWLEQNVDKVVSNSLSKPISKSGGASNSKKEAPNVFSRGFLIAAPGGSPEFVPDEWSRLSFRGYEVWHDSRLAAELVRAENDQQAVLILGTVVDSHIFSADLSDIADRLLRTLGETRGFSELDELVTWMGGRYVILAVDRERVRVHVDATASRSCFWAIKNGSLIAGSHSELVARAVGDLTREESEWVLSNPHYQSPAGKWLPGAMAPHNVVNMVVANCCLEISPHGIEHKRFFPSKAYTPRKLPPRIAAAEVAKELQIQFELGLHTDSEVYFGLTAGLDSRVLLEVNLSRLQELNATTFTYHSFEKNPRHSREDALAARKIAKRAGLKHEVYDLRSCEEFQAFQRAYYQTFTGWARFPALAETFYRELPAKAQIVLAIGPEIGTVFYKDRDPRLLTPAGLASKYTQSRFATDPKLVSFFEEYVRYTNLDLSPSAQFSSFDLFYWESRLSNWAAAGYSEYEMVADVVLPFNSRTVILPMLELSFELRLDKGLYGYLLQHAPKGNQGG